MMVWILNSIQCVYYYFCKNRAVNGKYVLVNNPVGNLKSLLTEKKFQNQWTHLAPRLKKYNSSLKESSTLGKKADPRPGISSCARNTKMLKEWQAVSKGRRRQREQAPVWAPKIITMEMIHKFYKIPVCPLTYKKQTKKKKQTTKKLFQLIQE